MLGRTVGEVMETMEPQEFLYWKAYTRINGPTNFHRLDILFARLAATIVGTQMTSEDREKHPEAANHESYLLEFVTPKEERRRLRKKYSVKNIQKNNEAMIKTMKMLAEKMKRQADGTGG